MVRPTIVFLVGLLLGYSGGYCARVARMESVYEVKHGLETITCQKCYADLGTCEPLVLYKE